jgi:ribosome-associated heat shock protein Hsp15
MSALRLDKLLWFLRLAKTRAAAQERIATGHLRLNGRRVERSAQDVRVGDVLTVPVGTQVRVIEVLALPARRGPAPEAQACYRALDQSAASAIAAPDTAAPRGTPPP